MSPAYPPLELTPAQLKMVSSIFDTIIGELTPEEEQKLQDALRGKETIYDLKPDQVSTFSKLSASKLNVPQHFIGTLSRVVQPSKREPLLKVLDLLNTRAGSLLLTGHWAPFYEHDKVTREAILLNWRDSRFLTLRGLYKVFTGLCLYTAYSRTDSALVESINHMADADVYFENHPDYDPIRHPRIPILTPDQIRPRYDVVVIGSGAGGGVAAAELSKAGHSVLVIEKGKYFYQDEIIQQEEVSYENMYDGGIGLNSKDSTIQTLSGGTLGGGTAVNYLVTLKPQHFVREEWAGLGLPHFVSKEFNQDLDRVFERIGASKQLDVKTKMTEKFDYGCKELGYPIEVLDVNTGGKPHYCSRCMTGCKSGIKHSTTNTWLLDALNAGAEIVDQTLVTRILTNKSKTKAVGVEYKVGDKLGQVECKRIIVACGALRTPGLLRASGLTNPHIGKHLRLQPIMINMGTYDEPIRQTEGPMITRVSNVSDNYHGDNYGAKIEEGLLLPGGLATRVVWGGSAQHKEIMMKHRAHISFVNVIRDKDSVGTVVYDPKSDVPEFEYTLSKHDEKSMLVCLERSSKILVASGARVVYSFQPNVPPFEFKEGEESRVDNPRFVKWIESIHKAGLPAVSTPLISVHQLGSCRMGTSPKTSVVRPSGETWECKGLFVSDGSVFPTAVGVNPMATIEAISIHISRNVISSLNSSRL